MRCTVLMSKVRKGKVKVSAARIPKRIRTMITTTTMVETHLIKATTTIRSDLEPTMMTKLEALTRTTTKGATMATTATPRKDHPDEIADEKSTGAIGQL